MALLDHEGNAEFPYCKDDVFNALLEAVPQIQGLGVHSSDKLAGRILAKAGVSLMSWGESIPISVVEVAPGRTRVSVLSTPKTGVLFGGAFDLGKNRRNIERILQATSAVLSRMPPVDYKNASSQESTTVAQRLTELRDLLDQDLITEKEFRKRKEEILSEI